MLSEADRRDRYAQAGRAALTGPQAGRIRRKRGHMLASGRRLAGRQAALAAAAGLAAATEQRARAFYGTRKPRKPAARRG